MDKEKKLAVLIDAENISHKYVEIILNEANALGNVIYKRIYGNWTTQAMGSWKKVILDNAIQPIQQYSNTTGKNASDSALIIDAMDLLYLGRLNGFCITASDSDYTRLATRLREAEMYVLGMGEKKTARSFISACSAFKYLDLLYSASEKAKGVAEQGLSAPEKVNGNEGKSALTEAKSAPDMEVGKEDASPQENLGSNIQVIKQALKHLAEEASDEEGWIFSGELGRLLNKQFPDFDVRNFKYNKFVPFVNSLGLFEMERDDKDPKLIYFRLKRKN